MRRVSHPPAQTPIPQAAADADDARVTPMAFESGNPSTAPDAQPALHTEIDDPDAHTTWTLADVEQIALNQNPALAIAASDLRASRGKHVQAGLYPNPVVGYHAMQIGNLGTSGQQGGFISQKIITGGKLQLDRGITAKEIDEAHVMFHAQEQRILNDVRLRFYDALIAERRLKLSKELDQVADHSVKATTQLVRSRQLSEDSLLQSQIEAERVHILLDNALNENLEARRRLWSVLGRPVSESQLLSGDVEADHPVYDWKQCLEMLLDNNFELHAARTKIDRMRLVVSRAKREVIPDIDLAVSIRHDNITEYDVANVQLGMPVPVFDRNQGNIIRAEAQLAKAIDDVRRRELDLRDRLAVAFREYDNARQQIGRYTDRILPRAQRSLQLVSDGYQKGQVDFLTFVTSQRTFVQTNLAFLKSVQDLRRAVTVIEGQLLSGSLL
ncbi:MAG: TolC family protein [Planctomycetaceae bacterium]